MSVWRELTTLAIGAGLVATGCAAVGPAPGMTLQRKQPFSLDPRLEVVAVAHADPHQRALLVMYPRTACSGSASTVFMDNNGVFLGAVGPGEAALLSIPAKANNVLSFSSVELTATRGSWYAVDEIEVPPAPSGILVSSAKFSARECGNGQYTDVAVATKPELELELANADVRWLEPRPKEGQAWLEAHGARVDELLGTRAAQRRTVVTRVQMP